MPVKVYKQSGSYKGARYSYVTADKSGKIKSRHTNRENAEAAARVRNAAHRKGRKKR